MSRQISRTSTGAAAVSIFASALLLSACASLPTPGDLPFISSPEKFESEKSLAVAPAAWPSDRWWQEFNDPQLSGLIDEGLRNAKDMRIAQARFARAEAIARQAGSRLLPTIDAGGSVSVAKQSSNYLTPEQATPDGWQDYGQVGIGLSWDLDFWGRNRAALAAAESDVDAAAAEAAAARLIVSAGIADAYAELARLYAERDAATNAIEVRRQTLNLMSRRASEGLENSAAVDRARSALATAEGDLAALDESIALTRNRIAALMGAGPDRGLTIARPAPTAKRTFGLPANLPADLIGRRPDIVAARQLTRSAASRIDVAEAAFYPNVNLIGVIGLQSLGLNALTQSGSDFGAFGPAVTLPIFNGGLLTGRYREAEATYQAAVAEYDGTLTRALREVADVTASYQALDLRLGRALEAERAAASAWKVASDRYRGGLGTYLDVLAAEDVLILARRNVAILQSRAFALDVALVRALGGGFRS
ncbi:MAG: efflux transporter outer membrane subunit [Alphaproteobacteria bacterium]|nr:efflux transporter outer membrane subunit [Alphaproteobacteria bacterium]